MIGYNLGNSHFRQGEATNDPNEFQRAIEEYQRVLEAKPNDADAKHNLALARQRLKEAMKQPPKQGQQGQPQQGGQGGQGNQQMPVGVQTEHKPLPEMKNLPSDAEVDSLLKALESDERQRQAEQAAEQPQQDGQGGMGQNLLQQALGAMDLDKDW
jgi:tetratricopeptide (TPR) repeat protein